MKHKKIAFTLVELIVVVTILAILATIGFVSYSGYLTGVRDTNRIASLTSISDGLELYRTKQDLPQPDDFILVKVDGNIIARQGYLGLSVLESIEYNKAGKDPKDDIAYSYYLTDDNKYYQLLTYLEESYNLDTREQSLPNPPFTRREGITQSNFFSSLTKGEMPERQRGLGMYNTTHAAINYQNRYPKVYGNKLGILTDTNKTTLQEVEPYKTAGEINITAAFTGTLKAYLKDNDSITGSGGELVKLEDIAENGGKFWTASSGVLAHNNPNSSGGGSSCNQPDITVGSYIISACNAGSIIAGTGSVSYGGLYQWGNNHDFRGGQITNGEVYPTNSSILVGSTTNDSSYSNSTFITVGASPYDWTSSINDNLWGNTTNTDIARKGPCETGYHVPSPSEWTGVIGVLGFSITDALLLPPAGYRNGSDAILGSQGGSPEYWSSSTSGIYAYSFITSDLDPNALSSRTHGSPIRCFKN